ncbi:MAG: sigma-70 family RNA polymerase sigma factor [Anaerohalosphaera sp.]|nr:sigma-70 family RNA polymerase sigma factor [Anaerohalosphaera sp.]
MEKYERDMKFERLVRRGVAGDRESQEKLAELVGGRVWRYFWRVTHNEDVMADMVQDTLMKMLAGLKGLRDASRFWPWVYRIARNQATDYLRQKQQGDEVRFSVLDEYGLDNVLVDERCQPDRNAAGNELKSALRQAIRRLEGRSRAVVRMRSEGMSYSEIGDTVGVSEGSARVTFMRAKTTMMGHLAGLGFAEAARG